MKFITLTGYYSHNEYIVNIESIACIFSLEKDGVTAGSYINFIGNVVDKELVAFFWRDRKLYYSLSEIAKRRGRKHEL